MKNQKQSEEVEPIEGKKAFDGLLKRMLSTPPKPHKKPEKSEQKKKSIE